MVYSGSPDDAGDKTAMLTVAGARVYALAWLLDPTDSQFDNMADIAAAAGCTRAMVSQALLTLTDSVNLGISHGKGAHTRAIFARAQREAGAKGRHSSQKKGKGLSP